MDLASELMPGQTHYDDISMPAGPTHACARAKHDKPCKPIGSVKQCHRIGTPAQVDHSCGHFRVASTHGQGYRTSMLWSGVWPVSTLWYASTAAGPLRRLPQEMLGHRPPMPWSIAYITRKPCQCGESLQHRCRSAMEAAARVHQAPMHRPALQREAGQGLVWWPLELHHHLQQAATSSAVSWQVMYELGVKSNHEVRAG